MTYLERENEKTLGELQRDAQVVRQTIHEEKKSQLALGLMIQKKQATVERLLRLFAHEVTSDDQRTEVLGLLAAKPDVLLLEPQVPFRPFLIGMATGALSNLVEINLSNNQFVDDDSVVALGHLIGSSPSAQSLTKLNVGGTTVRCRGLTSVCEGAVRRRRKPGPVQAMEFSLFAFNTEMFDDPQDVQDKLLALVQTVTAQYHDLVFRLQ